MRLAWPRNPARITSLARWLSCWVIPTAVGLTARRHARWRKNNWIGESWPADLKRFLKRRNCRGPWATSFIGTLSMHFLVTGGAGFIGSFLAEELIRRRHAVRILDNL